ncbi:MAG: 4'-phosphopantetheinyl transferase superfamily protein [Rhodanobacter sp.]
MKVTVPDDASGFITNTYWLKLGNHGHPLPPAFTVAFDARSYAPPTFQRLGIRCPLEIQRAVVKRQAEYLAGRVAARQAMTHLGMNVAELGTGPLRQPLWPRGVSGSITHTNDMAAAIAVPSDMARGIGIDIEHIIDTGTADAIRDTVVTDEELAIFVTKGGCDPNMLLTIAFSAKESFFKATSSHVGRYFEFHALRLTCIDSTSGRLTLMIAETLSPTLRTGQIFEAYFRVIDERTVLTSFFW